MIIEAIILGVARGLTPVMIMARRDNPQIYAWIDQAIAQKE